MSKEKQKELEELIKKLSKQVYDKVQELKAQDVDPVKDDTIRKMVDELVKKQDELRRTAAEDGDLDNNFNDSGRKSGGFNIADEGYYRDPLDSNDFNPYDIKSVYGKMLLDKAVLKRYYPDTVVKKIEEFKALQDDAYIVGTLLAEKWKMPYGAALRRTKIYRSLEERLKSDAELRKALYTSGTGTGVEWIPTGFSSQLLEKIRLNLMIANQFQVVNMPTNPYRFPVQSGAASGYLIPESTSDSATKIKATTPGTSNFEFTAKKLAARVLFSEEINEDAAINMLDFVRGELAIAISEALEKAILDGDDSTTHQDSDVTDANDARKAFKGLRYFALNNAGTATLSFSGGAPTTALLRNLRKLMGKYGVNPKNLFWGFSPAGYIQALSISEVVTVDKLGANATIVTGQLAQFDGAPVLVSEHIRDNLNASGVYDGVTTNLTVVHLVDKRGFWIGQRGGVTINTTRDFETDQIILVAKHRVSFKDPYDATSASAIQSVLGINVAT